jgi:uncharacterized membrane protein
MDVIYSGLADIGFGAGVNERQIQQIFRVSLLLKGAHAVIECVGGVALALVGTSTIANLTNALTQEELIEDPKDFIATIYCPWRRIFPSSRNTSMPSIC